MFAIIGALLLGVVLGAGKLSDHLVVRWPAWLFVEFFRAVPLLLVIIATWFAIGAQPGTNAFLALVLGLILYNGAVFAEIFRAGINAVPSGQAEAAYAIGMRKTMVMRIILIPQAVKIMLPSLISQAIVALKDTSLGYAVLAPGLTYAGQGDLPHLQQHDPDGLRRRGDLHRAQPGAELAGHAGAEEVRGREDREPVERRRWHGRPVGRYFFGTTHRLMVPCTVTVPSEVTALTDTGTSGAAAQLATVVSAMQVRSVVGLGQVLHLHALGQPAHVRRAGGLGQQAHGGLQPVARRDRVHGADVVLGRAALGHDDLTQVRPSSPAPGCAPRRSTGPSG